jgi:rsbT co-antagonist protein RsbR
LGNITNEAYQELVESEKLYREMVEHSREAIFIHSDGKIVYINRSGVELFGASSKEELIGSHVFNYVPEEYQDSVKARIRTVLEENKQVGLLEHKYKRCDGTLIDVEVSISGTPIVYKRKKAIQVICRDVSECKETERILKKALKDINELSAPLVPVIDGIAVLPLVGSIDSYRAKHILEDIPSKIKEQGLERLIIDFSGLYTLDTMVTDYLFKIHDVLRFLGVDSIITRIRPEIAQMAIQLGIDLSSVPTFATVKQALQHLGVKE